MCFMLTNRQTHGVKFVLCYNVSSTMQNTEGGRKLNQAMVSTGRAVATTGRAVGKFIHFTLFSLTVFVEPLRALFSYFTSFQLINYLRPDAHMFAYKTYKHRACRAHETWLFIFSVHMRTLLTVLVL